MSSARGPRAARLLSGLTVNRRRPDLQALAAEPDPERFVWRVLPHAARSFAASIAVLPAATGRAAAVAYLYCRMLDTYEDLIEDPERCITELRRFAGRFDTEEPQAPTPIPDDMARDDRDRVYLLLIARCDQVDAVFRTLPGEVREQIRALVRSMAEGMAWSTEAFADQGGILLDEEQLALYCRNVIGHPAVFSLKLVGGGELSEPARLDAFVVSEMVQLANVTRDIERDLARGIAYHPALKPYLGSSGNEPQVRGLVRDVREELLVMALCRAPAYRRLYDRLELGRTPAVRTAAVMMLRFTALHYRTCAIQTGHRAWRGPRGRLAVVAGALPALASRRWAERALERVQRDFAGAASGLPADTGGTRPVAPVQPAG